MGTALYEDEPAPQKMSLYSNISIFGVDEDEPVKFVPSVFWFFL